MVCGTGFSLGNFGLTFHVFFAFSPVSLTESCSFWHGLNDLFPQAAQVNLLSPNSDQHQFSPNNIHRLSSATSMRINQMITKRKISDLLSISPN